MDANEEYVRQRWEGVHYKESRGHSPWSYGIVYRKAPYGDSAEWLLSGALELPKAEAWQAARAFTEAREEEIRQVEQEIAILNLEFWEMHGEIRLATMVEQYTPLVRELCRWARILAREQAALAELKRGMK